MKAIRLFLCLLLAFCAISARAATLLPLAEQTFLDNNGAPLTGGRVFFYIPNTLTPKATYQNSTGSVSNSNPVILDGAGRAIIYGSGQYRQRVYDVNGNLIWDQLTADTSGGATYSWAGISAGTANAQTITAPNFTQGDGQQIGFIAGLSNSSAFTVIVNGGLPISVIQASAAGPQALSSGSIIAGNQYFLSYSELNGNFQIDTLPTQSILPSSPIASATTTDIGTLASHNANVSGSTTITSFGSSASINSQFYAVTFTGAPLITASSQILTITGFNIQAVPGASLFLAYLGGGVWQVISYNPPSGAVAPPSGRLTLTSATPVMSSPVSAATSILYTPYIGTRVPVWTGTAWQENTFAELGDLLSETTYSPSAAIAGALYDMFVWTTPGPTPVQVLSRSPAWTNTTTRALALSLVNGIWTNSANITNGPAAGYGVYEGTIATDAGSATVSFNPQPAAASGGPTIGAWVGLWNAYNRVSVAATVQDSKASWTYASSTWHAADGGAGNRVTAVFGLISDAVKVEYFDLTLSASGNTPQPFIGIGVGQTASASVAAGGPNANIDTTMYGSAAVVFAGIAPVGQIFFSANEATAGGSATFYGSGSPQSAPAAQMMQLSASFSY